MENNWWETTRQLVEINTHAWFMEDATGRNVVLRGWLLSHDSRGVQLLQQDTGRREENSGGNDKMRRVFIPWTSIAFVAEPEWKRGEDQLVVVQASHAEQNGVEA